MEWWICTPALPVCRLPRGFPSPGWRRSLASGPAGRCAGQLSCDRLLASRARLLVDLGVEFSCQDPPRRFLASLQAPPVAVLLTVMRACDLGTVIDIDDGASPSLGMGS